MAHITFDIECDCGMLSAKIFQDRHSKLMRESGRQ